jgi:hypothetical protein
MKALKVFENVSFQRGADPKRSLNIGAYAVIEKTISNPEEVNDLMAEIDQELQTAMEVYLPDRAKQEMARMWLSNQYDDLPHYEFSVLQRDQDEDDQFLPDFHYGVEREIEEGWELLHTEDNYGQMEAILFREIKGNL